MDFMLLSKGGHAPPLMNIQLLRAVAIVTIVLVISYHAAYFTSSCSAKGGVGLLGCLGDLAPVIFKSGDSVGPVSKISITTTYQDGQGPLVLAPLHDMPLWFRDAVVGPHEKDMDAVRELRALMKPIAVDNTVIIVSTNAGFFNMSLSMLCRMREIGVTNVLTWALDKESATALAKLDMPYYYDPTAFSVAKPTSYYDPEYVRMMTQRPAVWWRMLATGFDLLFLDSDIVVFDNPMKVFKRTADIEGQVDERDWEPAERKDRIPDMCAGAFWVRSKPQTLRMLDLMKEAIEKHAGDQRFDDQYALNSMIHNIDEAVVLNRGPMWNQTWPIQDPLGRLRVLFVEPMDLMGGRLEKHHDRVVGEWDYYNVTFVYKHRDFERRATPAVFHLNGRGVEYIKLKILHKAGWWEVTSSGQCRTKEAMVSEIAANKRRAERAAAIRAYQEAQKANATAGTAQEGPKEASKSAEPVQESSKEKEATPADDLPSWFSEVAVGAHKDEAEKVKGIRALMKPIAVNNTVIIISTNYGFFNMSLNILCRLRDLKVSNVLTWALDKQSADALTAMGMPVYYDPSLYSVSKSTSYYDPEYIRMMTERPDVWWRLLATGFDLLFLDSDVVVFENPMNAFQRTADIEGQVDERDWKKAEQMTPVPDMCAGAFWIRSSKYTLRFLDMMKAAIVKHAQDNRFDDQYALNSLLHNSSIAVILNRGENAEENQKAAFPEEILKVRFVEPIKLMGGRLEKHSDKIVDPKDYYNVTFSYSPGYGGVPEWRYVKPAVFHLNGRGKEHIKWKLLWHSHWWDVQDNGQCRGIDGMKQEIEYWERRTQLGASMSRAMAPAAGLRG